MHQRYNMMFALKLFHLGAWTLILSRTWKKMPKTEGIASVTLEKVAHSPLTRFVRWKVHNDWVAELRYYEEIRSIMSCSNNESTALVIGECHTVSLSRVTFDIIWYTVKLIKKKHNSRNYSD